MSMFKVGDRVVTSEIKPKVGTVISTERNGPLPVVILLDNGSIISRDRLGKPDAFFCDMPSVTIIKAPKDSTNDV